MTLDSIDTPPSPNLDAPSGELRIGTMVILLFFGLFLGWAAFAPLDSGAFAPGQVSISGNRQSVQHLQGGTVSALHVAEGDRVRRGQILIELSNGDLTAQERGLTGQVLALLAQRSRMIAERDRLDAIPTPPEFATLSAQDRGLADEALRLQRSQFQARRSGRTTETGVLQQRIGQLHQQQAGYERQIESNIEQRRLIQEELTGLRTLAAQGYAPENRVRALERTAAALDGELGSLRAEVARAEAAVGETRLQIANVSVQLNEDVSDQLRQVEVTLNDLHPRLAELRSQIGRSQIASPSTGQVVGLTAFTVGGVIQPGQVLMDIVPDEASQVIVAEVNPADIDNLRVGLTTEIKFPGMHERSIPILQGRVTRISADSFVDAQTGRSHYRAEVVIPPEEMVRMGPKAQTIRPGMPVEVVIVLAPRTTLQYLIEPLTRSLWRTGSEQ